MPKPRIRPFCDGWICSNGPTFARTWVKAYGSTPAQAYAKWYAEWRIFAEAYQ